MTTSVHSYPSSILYLIKARNEFEYSFYYENFCKGMSRDQVAMKFEKDLQDSLFDVDAADPLATRWLKEQIDNNAPIIRSQEVDEFWLLYNDRQQYYAKLQRESDYTNDLQKLYERNRASSSRSTPTTNSPPSQANNDVVEGDSIVFFNKRSISSILKSYGKRLFVKYQSLSTEEQALCGFCLNGILDLSNQKETGQRKIFTSSQWKYLNRHFKSNVTKNLYKLSDSTLLKLKKIIKELKGGNYEEAYYMSLESVRPAHPNDKCIFKILAHIINAYIENTEVFINPLSKVSELDFLIKVWSQVFELLFGNDKKLSINWGETVPETTTAVKRHNNNNKQNTIGCKVDGRIVCKLPKIVDTCHIEAAKATVDNAKLYSDKLKLAAECKCTLDDMIISGKLKGYKFVEIPGMQLFGIQANVCYLKLVDRGLYVNTLGLDLSLPNNLKTFSNDLVSWFRQLMQLKINCGKFANLSNEAFYNQQRSLGDVFQCSDEVELNGKSCNPDWVAGTFLPPTTNPPILPANIITSPTIYSPNRSISSKYEKITLDDGTEVISKFNKSSNYKKEKRNRPEEAEGSKKKNKT